jgi:hypothetical protein
MERAGRDAHRGRMNAWKTIRLELDRTPDFPTGSVSRAFLLRVPLDGDGRIDEAVFRTAPERATIRRHWSNEPDESGRLERLEGSWVMRCGGNANRALKLIGSTLRLGEPILVVDSTGDTLPFRIASIR